ncbi:MAG: hypothetical protein JWM16_169 [Verrucomicrobiales bacterium]|nr:hypothetical protein [Verrucomicrobiales bacterium]
MTLPLFAGGNELLLSPTNCAKQGVIVRSRIESPGNTRFEVILKPRSTPRPMEWDVQLNVADGTNSIFRGSLIKCCYSPMLSADGVLQPRQLITELAAGAKPISSFIWTNISPEQRTMLLDLHTPLDLCRTILAEELNRVVLSASIEQATTGGSKFVLPKAFTPFYREGDETKTMYENRLLLESTYKGLLVKSRGTIPEPLRSLPAEDKYQSCLVEFTISDKLISSSTLTLTKTYGEFPSYFTWWLYLKDFAP